MRTLLKPIARSLATLHVRARASAAVPAMRCPTSVVSPSVMRPGVAIVGQRLVAQGMDPRRDGDRRRGWCGLSGEVGGDGKKAECGREFDHGADASGGACGCHRKSYSKRIWSPGGRFEQVAAQRELAARQAAARHRFVEAGGEQIGPHALAAHAGEETGVIVACPPRSERIVAITLAARSG